MASNDNTNNTLGLPSVTTVRHGPYHSALVGASRAISTMTPTPSAIVPLQTNTVPMQFSTIRLNTNLNHLPHDWAKTKFQGYGGFNSTPSNAFSSFTSLNLAHNYMDLVGRVDVISSSKNIKDLLKMPYQSSPHISLMVHRLGKTLLLEEFDVHKNLIKKESEQWQWLNDFFRRFMNKEEKNFTLVPFNSPKKDLLSDWMYCNLIRHSITASVANNACTSLENSSEVPLNVQQAEGETQDLKGFHHESIWRFHDRSVLVDSDLPIFGTDSTSPCISLRLRDSPPVNVLTGLDYWLDNLMSNVPEVAMVYHLNGFVQKYEILRTEDIPHLENSKFDADEVMELARNVMAFIKNKAVVEGHTYWLYKSEHDDTVKLYNLTEYCKRDLRKDDNPFTVPVGLLCYNVGRNIKIAKEAAEKTCAVIRSMLENCLRLLEAETHPEVCADAHFMLADLWVPDHSLRDVWNHRGKISDLPEDAVDEFDRMDSPDVECNGNEIDSCTLKEEAEKNELVSEKNLVSLQNMSLLEESSSERKSPESSPKKWDEKNANEVMVKELMIRGVIKRKAWNVVQVCRIAGETDERCRCALDHIRKGLQIIDKDLARKSKKSFNGKDRPSSPTQSTSSHNGVGSQSANIERDQLRFPRPYVPIPLHYAPIHPKDNETSNKKPNSDPPSTLENDSQNSQESDSNTSNTSSGFESDDWHSTLKHNLLRKASLAFSILANQFHDSLQKRGHTLRYIRYGLHCYECLFTQGLKRQPDTLEEDIYLHLLHLAARARSCMDSSGIAANRKDFEELGEVEAAILHSAQAILQIPKETWVYTWPKNEEKNLKTAKELFLKVMKMKLLEKKSAEELRRTIKKQYGICILNIGHVYRRQLEERVVAGDTYAQIEPMIDRGKRYYEEAVSHFLSLNEKNTAGQLQTFMARLYEAAAEALKRHTVDVRNPVSKQEYLIVDKMMAEYEKALSIYQRDESADQCREDIYHAMRDKWYSLATRYFTLATQESYKKAKEHLLKSLSYCFLDVRSTSPRAFNSYRIGAIDHFNIAVICDRECGFATFDSAHHRSLRRKMNEHAVKAFELYSLMRWSRSQIAVKLFVTKVLMEEYERRHSDQLKAKKKAIRGMMWHFVNLRNAVNLMHTGRVDSRDDSRQVTSLSDGALKILKKMSLVLKAWLQMEKNTVIYVKVKEMYRESIRLLQTSQLELIGPPLSKLLTDIEATITLDISNSSNNINNKEA